MPHQRKRRFIRYSLRTFLIVSTVFCISLAWLGWRVDRARRQEIAIDLLKAKGIFMYQTQFDAMAVVHARLTGSWAYGDVYELILSHDPFKPLQIEFDPQDIELLKDFPYLKILEIHSSQRQETIARLADVASLEVVRLHYNDAKDPGVMTLKKLRPDLEVVTK